MHNSFQVVRVYCCGLFSGVNLSWYVYLKFEHGILYVCIFAFSFCELRLQNLFCFGCANAVSAMFSILCLLLIYAGSSGYLDDA